MENNHIYIFTNARVAAINKKDGTVAWETKLKKSGYYGQILQEGDRLYVGASGRLYCLATKDGAVLWSNELKGWGVGLVSIAGADSNTAMAQQIINNQTAAATAAVIAAS